MKKILAILIVLLFLLLSSCDSDPSVNEENPSSDSSAVTDVDQNKENSETKNEDQNDDQKEDLRDDQIVTPGNKQNQPIQLPTDEFE